MGNTSFFPRGEGLTLAELAAICEAELAASPEAGDRRISGLATLARAGPDDLSFFDNPRYAAELAESRAGCVVVPPRLRKAVPVDMPMLVAADSQRAFALAGRALFPAAVAPEPFTSTPGVSPQASVDPSARIEPGAAVEAFAVIGARAQIGSGTIVSPGAVIGPACTIGRDCRIGPNVTLQHAILGNRVIVHPGVAIGQDGFGYAAGRSGILKMVQIGRVIIQDDVEIGAGTTIDRGAVRDTLIGENTKIDNQVQIAHNVSIGRNCLIVSQVGIAGSATIEDGVAIGGQSGVNGHVTIRTGAQIAAVSSVAGDVPQGARWGGTPAHSVRDWMREMTWLREAAKAGRSSGRDDGRRDDGA